MHKAKYRCDDIFIFDIMQKLTEGNTCYTITFFNFFRLGQACKLKSADTRQRSPYTMLKELGQGWYTISKPTQSDTMPFQTNLDCSYAMAKHFKSLVVL